MTPKKLQQLKTVIQKASPEIVKLQQGCYITVPRKGIHNGFIVNIRQRHPYFFTCDIFVQGQGISYTEFEDKDVQVIGRPITLADVLITFQWIANRHTYYAITEESNFLRQELGIEWESVQAKWNLHKNNLDDQSEETQDWLYDVLVDN